MTVLVFDVDFDIDFDLENSFAPAVRVVTTAHVLAAQAYLLVYGQA